MEIKNLSSRLYIVLSLFILQYSLYGQNPKSSNSNHVEEIINTFKHYERNYTKVAYKRLLKFLNEDSVLKENFLTEDSLKYKNLKLIIRPILKFKKEAQNYTVDQDIFSLMEFDTIDYHCLAMFYLEDSLEFVTIRGHNECDIQTVFSPGSKIEWCQGEYFFRQFFYSTEEIVQCMVPSFIFDFKVDSFYFYIDFFHDMFIISGNEIMIHPDGYSYQTELIPYKNSINELLNKKYGEDWIRHCARECPAGGK